MTRLVGKRRVDAGLTLGFLAACEIESVTRAVSHPTGTWPLAAVCIAAAVAALPLTYRRRAVIPSLLAILTGILLLKFALGGLRFISAPGFVLFTAAYSVAAYTTNKRAFWGLGACVAVVAVIDLTQTTVPFSWIFSMVAVGASWAAGQIIRDRREVAGRLQETAKRIAEERASLELLAVAEQRTRIATDLQEAVAESVSAMIILAGAARTLLDTDPDRADQAMDRIENTGRSALDDVRRILGVLRRVGDQPSLTPAPGIGGLAELIENERRPDRPISLNVRGDPRPVPATVDLAVYRILEDALASSADAVGVAVRVDLHFEADRVELLIAVDRGRLGWPTTAMVDFSRLCDGQIDLLETEQEVQHLRIQLPLHHDRIPA